MYNVHLLYVLVGVSFVLVGVVSVCISGCDLCFSGYVLVGVVSVSGCVVICGHPVPPCRPGGLQCLLAVLKLLMNLTHESDLGSHRVGEQKGIMTAILNIILKVRRAHMPSFSTHNSVEILIPSTLTLCTPRAT